MNKVPHYVKWSRELGIKVSCLMCSYAYLCVYIWKNNGYGFILIDYYNF